jgi:long-subunit acyl-CoA synthetase (AMP-forming)
VCFDGDSPVAQSFDDFCGRFPAEAPDLFPAEDSLAAIMPTGGTTGRPKGMLTHRSLSLPVGKMLKNDIRGKYRKDASRQI